MVRSVLGRNRGGVRTVLDSAVDRCAPSCSIGPIEDTVTAEVTGRVIVRHRVRAGFDAEGVAEFEWITAYDGPGVWSGVRSVEDDDGSGAATETASVAVPRVEEVLATTATLWDVERRRWVVTEVNHDQAGTMVLSVTRRVDGDT